MRIMVSRYLACVISLRNGTSFIKSGLLAEALKNWDKSNYATLIHITNPIAFTKPFRFPKRDQRAWVLLDKPLMQTLAETDD